MMKKIPLFGSSQEEELRKAAQGLHNNQSQSTIPKSQSLNSFTQSSAYETASENGSQADLNSEVKTLDPKVNPDDDDNSTVTGSNKADSSQTPDSEVQNKYRHSKSSTSTEKGDDDDDDEEVVEKLSNISGEQIEKEVVNGVIEPKVSMDGDLHRSLSRISKQRSQTGKKDDDEDDEDDEGISLDEMAWDSPSDPGNPFNWSKSKKWFITMTTAFLGLVVTFGSSMYSAGVESMVEKGFASQELCIAGLTFYVLGLAFGPMLAAPISEVYGRRVVYITTFPLSMLFTMGVGFSQHIREVLVLRFFAGFLSSPALAVCSGTICDMWAVEDLEFAMVFFCMAPFCGPILGPVLGGFVAQYKGWRWTQWVDLFVGVVIFPLVAICPETYKPIIMYRRAKARGLKIRKNKVNPKDYAKEILKTYVIKPSEMLVVEPIVLVFSIYSAFVFAVLFGFFEAYPYIFRLTYRMELGISGLPFIGIGVGLFLACCFFVYVIKKYYWVKDKDGNPTYIKNGVLIPPVPESRLLTCKVGAIFLPIALFWVGWTGRRSVHWIVPTLGGIPFGFGLILIFFSTISYFSFTYPPESVASAIAANNCLRYILAAVFPLFTLQMYERLHAGWASSIFGFIAILMVPIPWIFEKYGAQLRVHSKYSYYSKRRRSA